MKVVVRRQMLYQKGDLSSEGYLCRVRLIFLCRLEGIMQGSRMKNSTPRFRLTLPENWAFEVQFKCRA